MVESSAQQQQPRQQSEAEKEVAKKYQALQQETQAIVSRLLELQDECKENELVMESLMKLEDDRRCWRLVNGVLFEKSKKEVVPELKSMIHNCNNIIRQLNDTLVFKKQESFKIEQAYESIMKMQKARQADQQEGPQAKAGGILA